MVGIFKSEIQKLLELFKNRVIPFARSNDMKQAMTPKALVVELNQCCSVWKFVISVTPDHIHP